MANHFLRLKIENEFKITNLDTLVNAHRQEFGAFDLVDMVVNKPELNFTIDTNDGESFYTSVKTPLQCRIRRKGNMLVAIGVQNDQAVVMHEGTLDGAYGRRTVMVNGPKTEGPNHVQGAFAGWYGDLKIPLV